MEMESNYVYRVTNYIDIFIDRDVVNRFSILNEVKMIWFGCVALRIWKNL